VPPPLEAERSARFLSYSEMYMPSTKTSSKSTLSKSDFVRAQPATLSAAEVLAKAKAAGLKLTSQLVYKVRSSAKVTGTPKKTTAVKKTSAPTKATVSTKPPKSKAAFVRGLPASTPAKDVVKQAKELGLSLSVNYVYNIRGAAKVAAKKKRAAAKSPALVTVLNGGRPTVSANAENLLKAVAAELGLGSALEILMGERARVRAVIGR
jgi:hypothetical protein